VIVAALDDTAQFAADYADLVEDPRLRESLAPEEVEYGAD
jgi:hypothetical protein